MASRPPDSWVTRPFGSILDVAATITFRTAIQITAVACTLRDTTEAVAGGINGTAGGFVNQLGTTAANTVWYVSYDDFNPTALALAAGDYTMNFQATRSDGDVECPKIGVIVCN